MYRFQYATLPLMAVEWPLVATRLMRHRVTNTVGARLVLSVVLLGLLVVQVRHWNEPVFANGNMTVGQALAAVPHGGQWMATTEAGLLPLYSGWNDIDTWGLNNDWIAHHGLSDTYLNRYQPALIMFHTYHSPCQPWRASLTGNKWSVSWDRMVSMLHSYALNNNYKLVAVYGTTPTDDDWFYVKPSAPDALAIEDAITNSRYVWGENGQVATNYVGQC
jgi:hypothetical protein